MALCVICGALPESSRCGWRVEQTLHGFLRKHCSEFCTEVSVFCTFIAFEKQYGALIRPERNTNSHFFPAQYERAHEAQ